MYVKKIIHLIVLAILAFNGSQHALLVGVANVGKLLCPVQDHLGDHSILQILVSLEIIHVCLKGKIPILAPSLNGISCLSVVFTQSIAKSTTLSRVGKNPGFYVFF